jgi:3-hydroxybutyrate dehydrogenase
MTGKTCLRDKVALVTGSTSGIGLGIVQTLASAGVHVMTNGMGDRAVIDQQNGALARDHKIKVAYHPADMSQPDQIAAMVAQTVKTFGRLDILINNAGIQHVAKITEFPPEKWDQIIAINLSAAFHTMRAALPVMQGQGWGRVINIASAHALVASPFKSAYVAAKHGIAGLTKVAALEMAESGITVNAICPGYVKTPLVENQIADTARARGMTAEDVVRDVLLKAQPTKQFVTIDQVAALALFLCDDAAANINGAMMSVDGGWVAQ